MDNNFPKPKDGKLTRRELLRYLGGGVAGVALMSCNVSISNGQEAPLAQEANETQPQLEWFTPADNLEISNVTPLNVSQELINSADNFQEFLNTPSEELPALAGYSYGYNDVSLSADNYTIEPQLPAFSWFILTGESVEIPEVGKVVGGPLEGAAILILNRDESVHRWNENSVSVQAGFLGTGRIWDGENNTAELEQRLSAYYTNVLLNGHPESGFVGQCDGGLDNCGAVRIVTVERYRKGEEIKWALIRAERIEQIEG